MSGITITITDQHSHSLKAMLALRELLAKRVAEASQGEISEKSISEIAEETMENIELGYVAPNLLRVKNSNL